MSVYRRMFGRALPCGLRDLVGLPLSALGDVAAEELAELAEGGRATAEQLYRLGVWHLAKEQPGLARKWLSASLKDRPEDVSCRLALALSCEMVARHHEAAAHLDAAVRETELVAGRNALGRYTLLCAAGLSLERVGETRAAAVRYHQALAAQPGEILAHHRLVAIYLSTMQTGKAVRQLRAILKHHPAMKAERVCLAHLLQLAGQYEEAAWEYEQALCLEPDSWELPVDVSGQLHQANGAGDAITVLEQLIGAQPHFPDLRMRLGNLYSLQGDDAAAAAEYGRALAIHPEYLDCHIAAGRHELRMGRAQPAAEHFRTAIAINEQNVELYIGLSLALESSGRGQQAAEILASAARIANNSAVLMAQLARTEQQCGVADANGGAVGELNMEWLEDLAEWHKAILVEHPDWNDIRVRRGMLLRLMGRAEEAAIVLMESLDADPTCCHAQMQLGLALADARRPDEAREAMASALRLDGASAGVYYRLGLIYCGEVEFDLAMENLENAASDPEAAQRRLWLAIDDLHLSVTPEAAEEPVRAVPVAK